MTGAAPALTGCKLMVATPIYDGAQGSYVRAALALALEAPAAGLAVRFEFLLYQPDVARARNMLSAMFLASDCTHLLFVDADIDFAAADIFAMLRAMLGRPDCAVLGAACPRRVINWNGVARAAEQGAAQQPGDLARFSGEFALRFVEADQRFALTDLVEVERVGTGLMLIRRDLFERVAAAHPDLAFAPSPAERQAHGIGTQAHAFFLPMIDPEGELLSDDYAFCRRVRDAGFRLWLAPWVRTTHSGPMVFSGSLSDLARLSAANPVSSMEQ